MGKTYREHAMEEMLGTIEDAMRAVMDSWAELPPPLQEAIEQFRAQLSEAIDSVDIVKRALGREMHEMDDDEA